MDTPTLLYLLLGLAMFGMTLLPRLLARHPLTVPSLYVGAGVLLGMLPTGLAVPQLFFESGDTTWIEHATELMVILSLAAVGLKLDRPFTLRGFGVGFRLVGLAMPLCIAGVAFAGHWVAGLALSTAVLLGAVLAPTDPVLAEDVQVDGPHGGEEGEVAFGLTLEAGLNDALAFPFVYLAIALVGRVDGWVWLLEWASWDLAFRVAAGTIVGLIAGRALAWYAERGSDLGKQTEEQEHEGSEGVFIVAAVFLVYGLTELVQGYGFLAVFLAILVAKRYSGARLNQRVHRFVSQLERLLLAVVLLAFGTMLAEHPEGLWAVTPWAMALLLVLGIRPLAAAVSLIGAGLERREVLALSFFGIRGVGSVYYLAYAIRSADFPQQELLWPIVAATILLSLGLHGVTATPVMRRLEG